MSTTFCPACGEENPREASACGTCGASLDPEQQDALARRRPSFRWAAAGACLGLVLAPLLLAHLVGPLQRLAFRPTVEVHLRNGPPFSDEDRSTLQDLAAADSRPFDDVLLLFGGGELARSPVVRGSLARLLWPALFFLAGGAATALIFRRRVHREVALAAAVLLLAQAALWLQAMDGRFAMLARPLFVVSSTGVYQLPCGLFLLLAQLLFFGAAITGAAAGATGVELATRRATCVFCGGRFPARPLPPACPHCHAIVRRGRVRWRWVLVGTTGTALLFSLLLGLGGPGLRFYDRCPLDKLSATCQVARRALSSGDPGGTSWRAFATSREPGRGRKPEIVVLHSWKYAGWLALAFVPAPLLLAWRLRSGALPTAGMSIAVGWLASTAAALAFFGLASFEGAFMVSLRLHLLAMLLWGPAGAIGALLGTRLAGLAGRLGVRPDAGGAQPP